MREDRKSSFWGNIILVVIFVVVVILITIFIAKVLFQRKRDITTYVSKEVTKRSSNVTFPVLLAWLPMAALLTHVRLTHLTVKTWSISGCSRHSGRGLEPVSFESKSQVTTEVMVWDKMSTLSRPYISDW